MQAFCTILVICTEHSKRTSWNEWQVPHHQHLFRIQVVLENYQDSDHKFCVYIISKCHVCHIMLTRALQGFVSQSQKPLFWLIVNWKMSLFNMQHESTMAAFCKGWVPCSLSILYAGKIRQRIVDKPTKRTTSLFKSYTIHFITTVRLWVANQRYWFNQECCNVWFTHSSWLGNLWGQQKKQPTYAPGQGSFHLKEGLSCTQQTSECTRLH